MDSKDLRSLQAPLKERFRREPEAARITLTATGRIDDGEIVCRVDTGRAVAEAGLHPASGGGPQTVCSGDMLLEALAACAGVTLKAVATALDIRLESAAVRAEGDLDFRGALGVAPETAVGFSDVRLRFELDCDATPAQRDRLIELTERYCIIYQTLRHSPRLALETHLVTPGQTPSPPGLDGVEDAEAAQQSRLDALSAAAAHAL
ncbi:MAG: OsmC family protein [bacterium]|nr:OsmC family protein [bacterium]